MKSLIRRQYVFLRREIGSKTTTNIKDKFKMLPKGFLSESKIIYDFENNRMEDYLSDYKRFKTRLINKEYSWILKDKLTFASVFRGFFDIPQNLAVIEKGKLYSIGEGGISNFNSLVDYLKLKENVVLKPISGSGGTGVLVASWDEEKENITVNGKATFVDEFKTTIKKLNNYFVNEFINQGEYGNNLNPTSLNTVRVLTMVDPDTGEPFIPAAVQRVGNKDSSPMDSWSQGGMSCAIDIKTGSLSKGVTKPKEKIIRYAHHPDTGGQLEGITVPYWNDIKGCIINAVYNHPFLKYVGWDVAITDEGFMVIEGNNMSDVNLLQVHKPLLVDERAKRFYEYYNVI